MAHVCGHDIHVSCLLGMTKLMADHPGRWNGTLVALFQPAEETGDGARAMIDDGLLSRIPAPDVALVQHVLRGVAGTAGHVPDPFLSAADSIKITVHGRGGHGSMPQNTIDPVAEDQVQSNLKGMDDLDFDGWNKADWNGVFARHHTGDVLVDWKGSRRLLMGFRSTSMPEGLHQSAVGTPPQITSHPIRFGSGDRTCVIGEFEGGGPMATVARWRDGAIVDEYIWS